MAVKLSCETVKRHIDEAPCDWCGAPCYVGDAVFIDLEHGTAYCSRACAQHDHFDRGYGPVCPGAAHFTSEED